MTKRDFELAKQVDLIQWDALPSGAKTPDHASVVKAQKFADLIRADEREACAKVCDAHKAKENLFAEERYAAHWLAEAIRARGNT